MSKDVMDANEVAEYLGISPSTVYKKVEYREIPFTKVGSLLRFPKWLIDEWLTRTAVQPDQTLFEQFTRLAQRYHLREFLKVRGLSVEHTEPDQLVQQFQAAVEDLKNEG